MADKDNNPTLVFFRNTPIDLGARPPLCSSLQSLESGFLLISLGRYPHALISIASAIESAIKAHFGLAPEAKGGFQNLVSRARANSVALAKYSETDLDEFRETRNRMIHHGFTPKDDHVAASLILQIGLPLLTACYQEFFTFDLRTALLSEFFVQLSIAQDVYQKSKSIKDVDLSFCFIAFAHQIRWSIKGSFMSNWEVQSLEHAEEGMEKFDACQKQKEKLEAVLHPSWAFDCPICMEIETFVCEMDDGHLDMGRVALLRGACPSCGLMIKKGVPFLTHELCESQVENKQSEILQSLGITPRADPDVVTILPLPPK